MLNYHILLSVFIFIFFILSFYYVKFKIICKIMSNPAPGRPNNPTKIEVTRFSPIWKLKLAPITLIRKIRNPPKIEFKTNFNIFFNGIIKIFPKINKKTIHAKKTKILLKSKYHHSFCFYCMIILGQILLCFIIFNV